MAAQVNGDVSSPAHNSAFLQHLLDYPFINDSITTVTSNSYAQRSIKLGDSAYQRLAGPFLPLLSKPYNTFSPWVAPYVQRADSLGDKTLDRIDEHIPLIKKPTAEIYNEAKDLIMLPLQKGREGRDHVFSVYNTEAKKHTQEGYIGQGKAAVATVFQVGNETLVYVGSYVSTKKADATKEIKEKINQ
ncbi:hypothetical protein K4F52_004373 [Lecanicillium sp. MT-2017a]|nr:hypothetical protein K4F52_004373 [Lecanicillium sp. MT-2017a]